MTLGLFNSTIIFSSIVRSLLFGSGTSDFLHINISGLFSFSLVSIFTFVIPKFKMIFSQTTQELPLATKMLLKTEYIFENYFFFIILSFQKRNI